MRALAAYLDDCRTLVLGEIRAIVPRDGPHTGGLYDLMLDYPLRHGKALRPALTIAVCRTMGGALSAVLPTAAVLELYHNAFLIHDDVEDGSRMRRHEATLNRLHGLPIAVNVGDGMLALAIQPLLDNVERVGLGRALRILRVVARMARETAEGQMLELRWINAARWTQTDRDYFRLVYKKTAWYSFLAPIMVGAIAAGMPDAAVRALGRTAIPLGVAFQIQDDVLNLAADAGTYGKDHCGDLWEGKHTLLLIHALRCAPEKERARALAILSKPPPGAPEATAARGHRSAADVAVLREMIAVHDSIGYAKAVARRHAERFRRALERLGPRWPESPHRDFLFQLADFTVRRAA